MTGEMSAFPEPITAEAFLEAVGASWVGDPTWYPHGFLATMPLADALVYQARVYVACGGDVVVIGTACEAHQRPCVACAPAWAYVVTGWDAVTVGNVDRIRAAGERNVAPHGKGRRR